MRGRRGAAGDGEDALDDVAGEALAGDAPATIVNVLAGPIFDGSGGILGVIEAISDAEWYLALFECERDALVLRVCHECAVPNGRYSSTHEEQLKELCNLAAFVLETFADSLSEAP